MSEVGHAQVLQQGEGAPTLTAIDPPFGVVLSAAGAPTPLANLVIAGVTKAGTTSLHAYLRQHPEVFAPTAKELNYFVPSVYGNALPDLSTYRAHFAASGSESWRLDSSPFYFVGGRRTAAAVDETLDRARVLIMLREPVARLFSSFAYKKSKGNLARSTGFSDFFEECSQHYAAGTDLLESNAQYLSLRTGLYCDLLPDWIDQFGDRLLIGFAEDLSRDPRAFVQMVLTWLGADDEVAASLDLSRRNETVQPRSQVLRRAAYGLNQRLQPILASSPRASAKAKGWYQRVNGASSIDPLGAADREMVEQFYRPSVAALGEILHRHRTEPVPDWVVGKS